VGESRLSFSLYAGVRQGGVLSPVLFSILINDLILKVKKTDVKCYRYTSCVSFFLFADDILLLSPSSSGLQTSLNTREREREELDMRVSAAKSMCIRFGHRFDTSASN